MNGTAIMREILIRFWATATGAAFRERRAEIARKEEGGNSESAARSKCSYVCVRVCVCILGESKSLKSASPIEIVRNFVERRKATNYSQSRLPKPNRIFI